MAVNNSINSRQDLGTNSSVAFGNATLNYVDILNLGTGKLRMICSETGSENDRIDFRTGGQEVALTVSSTCTLSGIHNVTNTGVALNTTDVMISVPVPEFTAVQISGTMTVISTDNAGDITMGNVQFTVAAFRPATADVQLQSAIIYYGSDSTANLPFAGISGHNLEIYAYSADDMQFTWAIQAQVDSLAITYP